MVTPFSVAIVDDRLRDLELVKTKFQKIKECTILYSHTNAYHFFEHLNNTRYLPNIVVTDCQMPEIDGMALTRLIKLFFPSIQVIVISGLLVESDVAELLEIGANAVIAKGSLQMLNNQCLTLAIEAIQQNKVFIDPIWNIPLVRKMLKQIQKKKDELKTPHFTRHELKILQLLATHPDYEKIADFLNISKRTVEGHVQKISEKTPNNSKKSKLMTYALKNYLIHLFRG
ncbi:response regulator transcription factor [Hydrotalea sp.]|uniref:response regulator n=1 Tax=Hydrotalea sp. TaxID=2881279 RepID=UPI0025838277|nr:response regulator transcription factor [Hydrotalea sp.]